MQIIFSSTNPNGECFGMTAVWCRNMKNKLTNASQSVSRTMSQQTSTLRTRPPRPSTVGRPVINRLQLRSTTGGRRRVVSPPGPTASNPDPFASTNRDLGQKSSDVHDYYGVELRRQNSNTSVLPSVRAFNAAKKTMKEKLNTIITDTYKSADFKGIFTLFRSPVIKGLYMVYMDDSHAWGYYYKGKVRGENNHKYVFEPGMGLKKLDDEKKDIPEFQNFYSTEITAETWYLFKVKV